METQSQSASLRKTIKQQRKTGDSIALVPTMGNLHAGHIKLVEAAARACDFVVASIFVNPLQFGANEDLDAYPRTIEADQEKLDAAGCDLLFLPEVSEIYGTGLEQQTRVIVPGLSDNYCGASRPGHFEGVATVVNKLFNITTPDKAFFGLKDYQQFLVIKKMAADLALPIEVIGIETQRDSDGLALSSRNGYLTPQERAIAPTLRRSLLAAAAAINAGKRDFTRLENEARESLQRAGMKPDYFAVCHAETLAPASSDDSKLVILAAAYLGRARLIDNILV